MRCGNLHHADLGMQYAAKRDGGAGQAAAEHPAATAFAAAEGI